MTAHRNGSTRHTAKGTRRHSRPEGKKKADTPRTVAHGATREMDWEQNLKQETGDCATANSTGYWEQKRSCQRVKGPQMPMDLPFWDECFSTSLLYSKPTADWNKGRTVNHPEGQDGSQPPSPGARLSLAPCLVLQHMGANTTAPGEAVLCLGGTGPPQQCPPPQCPTCGATALTPAELQRDQGTGHTLRAPSFENTPGWPVAVLRGLHRPQVWISVAPSDTPYPLGPAGPRTCHQSPGLHRSARSASQHQPRTRVPLRTARRERDRSTRGARAEAAQLLPHAAGTAATGHRSTLAGPCCPGSPRGLCQQQLCSEAREEPRGLASHKLPTASSLTQRGMLNATCSRVLVELHGG